MSLFLMYGTLDLGYIMSRGDQMAAVAQAAVHSQGTKGEFAEFAGYGQKRRYYTPAEVAMHNCTDDCWVTVCGKFESSMLYAVT
jgi:hypothetical protein